MTGKSLKILSVEDDAISAQAITLMLARADSPIFDVVTAPSLMAALDLLGAKTFDVILLDLSLPDSTGLGTLTTILLHAPQVPVLVLTGSNSEALASSALQCGAQDYLVKGQFDGNGLARALRYAVSRQASKLIVEGAPPAKGVIIGVLGAKGGAGVSTIATHLAPEIKGLTGQEVLLIDLDVIGGTVAFLMKAEQRYTVLDASLNLHRLDAHLFQTMAWRHSSGVDVLQSPGTACFGQDLLGERIRHLLRFSQTRYAWIILDMGRLNGVSMNALAEIGQLLLVTTPDLPALYEAKRIVERLSKPIEPGYAADRIRLIFNRASRKDVDISGLEKTFGLPIDTFLPEVAQEMTEAYSKGQLLPPESALRKRIRGIARDLTGVQSETLKRSFRDLLGLQRDT